MASGGPGRLNASGGLGGSPLDWSAPWFAAFGALSGFDFVPEALDRQARAAGLTVASGRPLSFVAAGREPGAHDAAGYERRIFETGRVATRTDGEGAIHDGLNALVWLHFPLAKARLNALQVQALDAAEADVRAPRASGGPRGALRDAITLFDENGLVLVARTEQMLQSLRERDWHRAFVTRRARWGDEIFAIPFGHGLLQRLLAPYKGLTAHAWPLVAPELFPDRLADGSRVATRVAVPAASAGLAAIDQRLAQALDAARLAAKPFLPVPVLGIPGWWPANADAAFYNDPRVFRPSAGTVDVARRKGG